MLHNDPGLLAAIERKTAAYRDDVGDIDGVTSLIERFREQSGNGAGGSLRLVIDEQNCDDDHVSWCAGYAAAKGDQIGIALAELLWAMPSYDRVMAIDQAR